MEGAKNAYRGFQEARRADTPNQGLSGRQEPRQPPAKPVCTVQAVARLVGGRRPMMLQRWGSGVLPSRFPVALNALPEPWRLGGFEARFRRLSARKPSLWLVVAGNAPRSFIALTVACRGRQQLAERCTGINAPIARAK